MGRDEALYARSKRGDLVCAMQTWSPRLWPTNWRASTFVFDKLSRQFMQRERWVLQRCAREREGGFYYRGFHTPAASGITDDQGESEKKNLLLLSAGRSTGI